MKKAHKFRICMVLSLVLAVILVAGAGYLLVTKYLATKDIDFTWTTNILLGVAGILIVFTNYCNQEAKENSRLFD